MKRAFITALSLFVPISAQAYLPADTENPETSLFTAPKLNKQPKVILLQSEWVEVSCEDLQALTFGERFLRIHGIHGKSRNQFFDD